MTLEQIIEGARLISGFTSDIHSGWLKKLSTEDEKIRFYKESKYHTSLDWLIPVMEKIKSLGFIIEINIMPNAGCDVFIYKSSDDKLSIIAYSNPIEAIYSAVIQFIGCFNEHNN